MDRWRTLPNDGRSQTYPDEVECRAAAKREANRTGVWCGVEQWDEEHPQDSLNQGWALVGCEEPS